MDSRDLCELDAASLARAYRARALSPVEVTHAYLDRIDALDPRLNTYITVLRESALAEAKRAESDFAAGESRGPFQGVPVNVKDLFHAKGVRTTAGSRILKDHVAQDDSRVVRLLRDGGAVLLGKANLLEFAYAEVHPDYGPVDNPWRHGFTASGSSSGSAASVAAGLACASVGTDTGGSVRLPAAYCGIVGMKPTYGRISRFGLLPLSWSLDHAGPMTRTVADNAALLELLAGPDPRDPTSLPDSFHAPTTSEGADLQGVRIGVLRTHFEGRAAPDVMSAVESSIARWVDDAGAVVVNIEVPELERSGDCIMPITLAEASSIHEDWYEDHAEDYHPGIRLNLEAGMIVPAVDYLRAMRYRSRLAAAFNEAFRDVDVLALPTDPTAAYPEGAVKGLGAHRMLFTAPFNLTGLPALSLPCGLAEADVPIGLQIVGRRLDEAMVYRVGAAHEHLSGWGNRLAPV